MTTNHLPECKAGYPPLQGQGGTGPAYVYPCICPQLRACEQRVREEESRNVIGSVSLAAIGEANLQQYQLGFSEGLDAAREAVVPQNVRSAYLVSLSPQEQRIAVSALELAARAIDALRNPPSLPPTTGRAHKY